MPDSNLKWDAMRRDKNRFYFRKQITLSREMIDKIEAVAKEQNMNFSEWIRQIIENHFFNEAKASAKVKPKGKP